LDVTSIVNNWVSNPNSNKGLVLKSFDQIGVQYNFASSEFWNATLHPKLTVKYGGGSSAPTATPTKTPASTAVPPTATPTRQPTNTPVPPTATPAPATPTNTPVPGGQEHTVVFQRGTNGYDGIADSFLNGWDVNTNNGSYTQMWLRSGEWMQPVLRFDLSSIPANATVTQATLSLWVNSSSNTYSVDVRGYRLNRGWEESQVTWNQATNGQPWGQPGANEAGTDRAFTYKAQTMHSGTSVWLDLDVRALAQNWVSTPGQNAGILLKGVGAAGVRYDLISSEYWNVSQRPKLTITYRTP